MLEFFSNPWNYLGFALIVNILKVGVIIGEAERTKNSGMVIVISLILIAWISLIFSARA